MNEFTVKFDFDNPALVIKHGFDDITEYWFHFGDGHVCITEDGLGEKISQSVCYELDWVEDGDYNIIVDNREK